MSVLDGVSRPVLCMVLLLAFCFLKPWSPFLSYMLRVGVNTSKGTFISALISCSHLYDYVNDDSDLAWLPAKEGHLLGPVLEDQLLTLISSGISLLFFIFQRLAIPHHWVFQAARFIYIERTNDALVKLETISIPTTMNKF